MKITSTAFIDGGFIPAQHSRRGGDASPPLTISGVPPGTISLALVCHDPDAPRPDGFAHWVVWNIAPDTREIASGKLPSGAIEGLNDWGAHHWGGPQPPGGVHRYIFYLYALDTLLSLPTSTNRRSLEETIQNHLLETATTTGLFGVGLRESAARRATHE